ncbi:MAG TPA: DUF4845 domain-containing protein [Rhodocyclaceae bacterium]|jgi:hypothetical protein|nr:DUF4845 domain-containing protein [Rhodocyclaceae bacterium]
MHAQPALNRQRGVSLGGLLIWCIIIGLSAVLVMKVTPDVIEYLTLNKIIKAVTNDPATKEASVNEIRDNFAKRAGLERIQAIEPTDLDISKEGDQVVLSFSYSKKIHLAGNVSLLLDFEGSTNK